MPFNIPGHWPFLLRLNYEFGKFLKANNPVLEIFLLDRSSRAEWPCLQYSRFGCPIQALFQAFS